MKEIDLFFLQKDEPLKSCLLFLREFILGFDGHMSEAWKYNMPFFYYKGDRICYLWVDKKTQQPYLGFTDGTRLTHPLLVAGDRARMKIMTIDAEKDLPVADISEVLNLALSLYRPRQYNT